MFKSLLKKHLYYDPGNHNDIFHYYHWY